MRFSTKFDRWLVALLIVAAAVSLGGPTAGWLAHQSPPFPVLLFAWVIWIGVLLATLPQYYEVRDDGLFIRQGWRKALIPYASLVELQPNTDSRSAGVFSTDRLLVVTNKPRTFVIALADQEGFVNQVALKAPHLERKGFGLGLPFSSTTGL
ncbi:MAG: PH domain-containing protein [Acidobacteriia bacterium]|nr:PH domain-containing protein [Terriglobia bacterium]